MGKFGDRKKKASVGISTASLPDIVFMILFFFMVTTTMREVELQVQLSNSDLPIATQIKKLEQKSLVSNIYVGKPVDTRLGESPRFQLNNAIYSYDEISRIIEFVSAEREKLTEPEKPLMTVSLKVHKDTKMKLVTAIKQELRKASALKINYSSRKEV